MNEQKYEPPSSELPPGDQMDSSQMLTRPIGALAGVASMKFSATGTLTATANAVSSATAHFDNVLERAEWLELFRVLEKLNVPSLRVLAALPEQVIPKLEMLTKWRPKATQDHVVRLMASAVLSDKLVARERSHARTLALIAMLTGVLGFALGWWLRESGPP